MKKEKVDILEGNIPKDIMEALLRDHTTQHNIFWATKDYPQLIDHNYLCNQICIFFF